MIYKLFLRHKCGALVIIEGYDVAIQYLEEHWDSIAYFIREEIREPKTGLYNGRLIYEHIYNIDE